MYDLCSVLQARPQIIWLGTVNARGHWWPLRSSLGKYTNGTRPTCWRSVFWWSMVSHNSALVRLHANRINGIFLYNIYGRILWKLHFLLNSNKRITPLGVRNNVESPLLTFNSSLNSSKPEHSTIICHGMERFVAFRPPSRYCCTWSHEAIHNFEVFTTDFNAVWMCVHSSYCNERYSVRIPFLLTWSDRWKSSLGVAVDVFSVDIVICYHSFSYAW
jgi:hypothetical protein